MASDRTTILHSTWTVQKSFVGEEKNFLLIVHGLDRAREVYSRLGEAWYRLRKEFANNWLLLFEQSCLCKHLVQTINIRLIYQSDSKSICWTLDAIEALSVLIDINFKSETIRPLMMMNIWPSVGKVRVAFDNLSWWIRRLFNVAPIRTEEGPIWVEVISWIKDLMMIKI